MSDSTEKSAYYYRVISLVIDVGTETLRDTFYSKVPKNYVAALFATPDVQNKFRELKENNVLTQVQYAKVTDANPDPDTYDISLLTALLTIIEVSGITAPSTGWGRTPEVSDISIGANLIRLRQLRNEIVGHRKDAQLDEAEFRKYFGEVEIVLVRLASHVGPDEEKKITDKVTDTKHRVLEPLNDREKKLLEVFLQWHKEDIDKYKTQLHVVQSSLEFLHEKVDNTQTQSNAARLEDKVSSMQSQVNDLVQNFSSIALMQDDMDQLKETTREKGDKVQKFIETISETLDKMQLQLDSYGDINAALLQQATTSATTPNKLNVANPNALSEKEILDVSKNIGSEWEQLRIHLDYTKPQSDALKGAYCADLQQMIHEMLKSWHDVVVDCGENPRMLLAAAFVNASSNYAMACKLVPKDQLDKNAVAQEATTERIQKITFRKFGYDQGFSSYHPGYGSMQISVYGGNNQFGAGSSMAFHNTQSINSSRETKDVTDPLALPPESTLPADSH